MASGTGPADPVVAVRPDDAFDVRAVHAWLGERVAGLGPEPPGVRQFPGGASNLTYLLRYRDRELILRRPPPGTRARGAHDMVREYRLLAAVRPAFPYAPAVVALCEDADVLGDPWYVMERIPGTVLRRELPAGYVLPPASARALAETCVDTLVELHAVDVGAAGLGALDRGPGYVGRQVDGWTRRYARARTPDVPDAAAVTAWLAARQPADRGHVLVHNDFRMDNLVLDLAGEPRVTGVLDWEMATVGDPLMDLGGALAYWAEAGDDEGMHGTRRQPTHLPGMLTRREVRQRYAERSGRELGDTVFYEVFGLFRLAAILQQIYRRYVDGAATNPEFAGFAGQVTYLEERCRRVIEGDDTGADGTEGDGTGGDGTEGDGTEGDDVGGGA